VKKTGVENRKFTKYNSKNLKEYLAGCGEKFLLQKFLIEHTVTKSAEYPTGYLATFAVLYKLATVSRRFCILSHLTTPLHTFKNEEHDIFTIFSCFNVLCYGSR
jgi:hypothetical protein